jgi:hypothetical protein
MVDKDIKYDVPSAFSAKELAQTLIALLTAEHGAITPLQPKTGLQTLQFLGRQG